MLYVNNCLIRDFQLRVHILFNHNTLSKQIYHLQMLIVLLSESVACLITMLIYI